MAAFRVTSRHFAKSFRFIVWLLICTFFLPAPVLTAGAVNAAPVYHDDNPANAHIMRRLNSPERARVLEEAARLDAAAREEFARGEGKGLNPSPSPLALSPTSPHNGSQGTTTPVSPSFPAQAGNPDSSALTADGKALDSRLRGNDVGRGNNPDSYRPQSVTEVLFNYAAGFAGVPGLTPRLDQSRGADGSLDEGLGFHQDGTVRRAGGVDGASGPSDRGQRARTYMQSGLQNGYGLGGYGAGFGAGYGGLYDEFHYDLWGRNDPTRGGRISGSGAYGSGYSRELGDLDPFNMAIDRGLNWGAGMLNSAGEAAISGLVDGGRARLNFRMDRDGYFNGEGDALLPFYDGKYTTVYTQLGARSMHDSDDTRWIGNVGLGQRWFPFAEGDDPKSGTYDAGNLMLGYNAFFDYDFTRDHQRGGLGIEAQYDWLRLASNYYFPLSDWKGSEDFDSRFVKERAAEGWDVRAKGYLPFYRNMAITGAYSQWYGDHVGMFGADHLEKDPKVWSYGLEYTPVPLVSGFITQKSTERGRTDTEFGLTFTYHFQMPWEDQISHAKVAELRTVGGSRHEFVDRENRIILEYKAKNSYRIEYLGADGARGFLFRIRDGFGEFKAGQTVRVTAGGAYLAQAKAAEPQGFFAQAIDFLDELISVKAAYAADFSKTYVTDGQGRFWVQLDSTAPASTVVTIEAGSNTQTFTLQGGGSGGNGLSAASPTLTNGQSTQLTLTTPAPNSAITWAVTGPGDQITTPTTTDASGKATATLTAAVTGNGMITVKATVDSVDYTCTVSIGTSYSLVFGTVSGNSGSFTSHQTATIPATVLQNGLPYTTATPVTWSIQSVNNSANQAVTHSDARGLAWGGSATSSPGTALTGTTTSNTSGAGVATIDLTDILGERTITVRASVTVGGQTVTQDETVTFGAGPLQYFKAPLSGTYRWADNSPISSSSNIAVSNFPAANACGTTLSAAQLQGLSDGYHAATKLPSQTQLKAVSQGAGGNSAWIAAGWSDNYYWTGEVDTGGLVAFVVGGAGGEGPDLVHGVNPVVCLR